MSREGSDAFEEEDCSPTVLYEQLQCEYNKLLKRYAQAENTIDKLRTGARIRLYADSRDTNQSRCGVPESAHHLQRIDFPRPLQASVSSVSGVNDREDTSTNVAGGRDRNYDCQSTTFTEKSSQQSLQPNSEQDDTLVARIHSLKSDVESLEICLCKSDGSSTALNEMLVICKQLYKEHEKLGRDLKSTGRSSWPSSRSGIFISKNDLEKELYRIGLRLREIQQDVLGKLNAVQSGVFSPRKRSQEEISEKLIEPVNQSATAVDPDLAVLVRKLKNLHHSSRPSTRNCREDLNSAMSEVKNSTYDPLPEPSPRARRPSFSESRDVVDARYLAASPVHVQYEQTDYGDGREEYMGDYEPHEEWSPDDVPSRIPGTHMRDDHYPPSQYNRASSSDTSGEHSLQSSKRPMDAYNPGSHGSDARADGDPSSSQNPVTYPKDKRPLRDDSRIFTGSTHENVDENRDNEYVSPRTQNHPHKSNSLTSLVDSSRMSTPLFLPRGAAHLSSRERPNMRPRGSMHKQRNPSDGCDSGFVGSEESRSSRMGMESPDIMQKLNLSNHWDSSLQLDLVTEDDENDYEENDFDSSHERLSTTYELPAELVRKSRSSTIASRTPRDTGESTLVNSSPSPPLSPERTRRMRKRHFGHSSSRNSSKCSPGDSAVSFPRSHAQLSDPSPSRISERPSSVRISHTGGISRASRNIYRGGEGYSSPGSQATSRNVSESRRNLNRRRSLESMLDRITNDKPKRDSESLQAFRNEIDQLRSDIMDKLNEPQVTLPMYDELRRHDEESRKALERKNDRKIDDLRESIDRLANDVRSREMSVRFRQKTARAPKSYDDFRSEVKKLNERLDELSELQRIPRDHPVSSVSTSTSFFGDEVGKRISDLSGKVDELRLRLKSDVLRNKDWRRHYDCALCDNMISFHHGYHPVQEGRKLRTSTPLGTKEDETAQGQSTAKPKKMATFHHRSSTYSGTETQFPVVHHIHTYHRAPRVQVEYESESSSDEGYSRRRTKHSKRTLRRPRHRAKQVTSKQQCWRRTSKYRDSSEHKIYGFSFEFLLQYGGVQALYCDDIRVGSNIFSLE